jgi:hypothetical protein
MLLSFVFEGIYTGRADSADALHSVGGAIAFELAEVLDEHAARIIEDHDAIERKRLKTVAWRESRTGSVS